jgi:hypothetical protein
MGRNIPGLADQIDFLVRRKFRDAIQGTRNRGEEVHNLPEANKREVEKYQAELNAMRPEEVQALYEQEYDEDWRMMLQKAADIAEAERFFNRPAADADFEHWSKAAYWRLDEAIALSFGKAPEVVSWDKVKDFFDQSPFAKQYCKVADLVFRAAHCRQLSDPVQPGVFLAWAKRNDINYPAELEKQVVARGQEVADCKSLYDRVQTQYNELKAQHDAYAAEMQALLDSHKKQRDDLAAERNALRGRVEELEKSAERGQAREKLLLARERETALKLIIAMAIRGYVYDPKAKRSDKVSEIVADVDSVGLSLDDDTVRKWLREAAELLPPESLNKQTAD